MNAEEIATFLIFLMEENGLPIDSKSRMRTYIYHALNEKRIKFIEENGVQIGFMMWEEHKKCDEIHIYVSQLVILPIYTGYNLKKLASFLKEKYKISNRQIHWRNSKRDKQVDFNKKEVIYG